VFDNVRERGAAIDSLVSGGCIVAGASVHRSVLFVQSRVEMGSVIEDSLLLPNATVGSRCTIRRAIIDAGCQIPDGMNIGCDAESDARYFHRSPGGVVLVTRDMLENFTRTHTDSPRAHVNSGSFPRKMAGNL
jgi:glucose-1-phosphate adenylyltransferase